MAKAKKEASALPAQQPSDYTELVRRLSDRYAEGRQRAAAAVNANMLETYWQMGHDIVEFEQGGKAKAEYGAQLLDRLSADLRLLHGKGFSHSNLARMRQFYLQYPIFATASQKLSWSHYVELMKIPDENERSFYTIGLQVLKFQYLGASPNGVAPFQARYRSVLRTAGQARPLPGSLRGKSGYTSLKEFKQLQNLLTESIIQFKTS